MDVSLLFWLRIIIPWHVTLQEGEKVFLAGGMGYVRARRKTEPGPSKELGEVCCGCCSDESIKDGETGEIQVIRGFVMHLKNLDLILTEIGNLLKVLSR